ncbi:biogenesis of lysosome-related organelles complex 1 subunit 4 [Dendroctonus ponderosae]
MKNEDVLRRTAEDYSSYITNTNIEKKLEPVNKAIDDMLARLEEFEAMFTFIEPDVKDSKDILNSILAYKPEFEDLCAKIDSTEFLVAHIKSNLDMLEAKIEEAETKLGVSDTTSKVTEKVSNIFTPLFKKAAERRATSASTNMELFKTEDYFQTTDLTQLY